MTEEQQTVPQEDIGTVVSVRGKLVKVELVRGSGCKSCSLRGMCFGRNTPAVFELESDLELVPGDRVQLMIAPSTRVLTSLMVFGLPLLCLFAGYLIGSLWLAELPSIGIAFAATALSFFIMRKIDKKFGNRLQVRIGSKI
ncbi:MAG: SoxR reducing system RseC family protein [Candidatus Cloacimonetes bacterium]|nr:SoxR reducing system RseC family protein [Candidatus Cloacimonadota bacterium]